MRVPVVCYGKNRACGKVLRWIEMPSDGISHGLCPECYKIELQRVNENLERLATWQFNDAFRQDEALRQKEEAMSCTRT